MKQSTNIGALAVALVAIQKELKPIVKDSENPHFKSKFASLDSITEYVRPLLASHGIAILQGGGDLTNGGLMVETTLLHESGQWISASFEIPIEKATPQAAGSSITYGRRYSLSAILALATDEDDDANRASEPKARAPRKATEPRPSIEGNAPITRDSTITFGQKKGTKISDLTDSFLQWGCEEGRHLGERTKDWQAAFRAELAARDGVPA